MNQARWEKLFPTVKFIFLCVVFAAAYSQTALYTSNQNNYFIHGLARGGFGFLNLDWTANTIDPYPIFTRMVQFLYSHLSLTLTYYIYAAMFAYYIYGLMGIVAETCEFDRTEIAFWVSLFIIIGVHSTFFCDRIQKLTGVDWRELLVDGVAGLYTLGTMLQPSSFGIFFILSVYLFLKRRPFWAVLVAGGAPLFHSISVVPFVILVISYFVAGLMNKDERGHPVAVAAFGILVIAPVLWYIKSGFSPTSAELSHQAQTLLINYRLPHHTIPAVWYSWHATFKIIVMLVSFVVLRKKRVFPILLTSFTLTVAFTLIRVWTNNTTLALAMPWRTSAWFVPIASCLLIGEAVAFIRNKIGKKPFVPATQRWIECLLMVLLVAMGIYGVKETRRDIKGRYKEDHSPLLEFVRDHRNAQQLYLTPQYLADFRLQTGVPLLADFKTHPHKDTEVLEWYKRMTITDQFYSGKATPEACETLKGIVSSYGVTNVLVYNTYAPTCSFTQPIFKDDTFTLLEVNHARP